RIAPGTPPIAGRFCGARWIPMRLLHVRPDLLGRGHARRSEGRLAQPRNVGCCGRGNRVDRRGNPRADERKYLPVRGLSEYSGRYSRRRGRSSQVRPFTYERATDLSAAVAAMSKPGARFISGGTNLLDLMKLEVERPTHLVDISRLPLKGIDDQQD